MDINPLRQASNALLAADPRAVPLLSNGTCLVDQPVSLSDILAGLANVELPEHAKQL